MRSFVRNAAERSSAQLLVAINRDDIISERNFHHFIVVMRRNASLSDRTHRTTAKKNQKREWQEAVGGWALIMSSSRLIARIFFDFFNFSIFLNFYLEYWFNTHRNLEYDGIDYCLSIELCFVGIFMRQNRGKSWKVLKMIFVKLSADILK